MKKEILNEEIFIAGSFYGYGLAKTRLIRDKIIPYECQICKNTGEWINKKLVLQIDHINGINNDHRLENLRFLCPNCHSQTKTYTGGNSRGKSRIKHNFNFRVDKRKQDLKSWEELKNSNFVKNRESGWTYKISSYLEIHHRDVGKWILKIDPEFYFENENAILFELRKSQKELVYEKIHKERKEKLINSGIDFSKFGWVRKAANLLDMKDQKINSWMKKHCPEILDIAFKKVALKFKSNKISI